MGERSINKEKEDKKEKMKRELGILGLALIGVLVVGTSMVTAQAYGLDGFVKFSNGTQCSGANVTITNNRTGETMFNVTGWGGAGFEGYYLGNAANFPSGYIDGDNLTYYTTITGYDNTSYHTISVPGANMMNITLEAVAPAGNASVVVTDGSISFGNLQLSTVKNTVDISDSQSVDTTGAGGNQLIEIKLNSSTVIGDANSTVLTFVTGSPGNNELKCEFKGGDVGSYTALTAAYQTFDNAMIKDFSTALNIQLTTPSSVSNVNYYDDYQFEIIVRATLL